jgi:hypothetical protein
MTNNIEPDEAAAENEGMPPRTISYTVEQIDPGDNHKELMEMLGGIFVQLSRVYDTQMMLLSEDNRNFLINLHNEGGLAGDPPLLREDAWE